MCSPGLVMATQAVGAANSAYGAYSEGVASKSYYDYLATKDRQSADSVEKSATMEATAQQTSASLESDATRRKGLELEGSQKAAMGANMGGGSVTGQDIVSDTFTKEKLDQQMIKYNADMATWKTMNDAKMKEYELNQDAAGYNIAGNAAKRAGKIGAFTSLLSGASSVGSTYYLNKLYSQTAVPKNP